MSPSLPRLPWPSTMPMQTWVIVCGCPVGWSSAFSLPKSVLSGKNLGARNRRRRRYRGSRARRACAGVVAEAAEAAVAVDDADADVDDCVRVPRRVVICLQLAQIGADREKSRGAESATPTVPRLPWPSTLPMQTWMIVCGCPAALSFAFSLPKSVLPGKNLGAPNRRRRRYQGCRGRRRCRCRRG